MFIRDYLDEQRIKELYEGQSIVDHKIKCISESATVVIIERLIYQKYFRDNEFFSKSNMNEVIWGMTPKLSEFGVILRNKIARTFELIHC